MEQFKIGDCVVGQFKDYESGEVYITYHTNDDNSITPYLQTKSPSFGKQGSLGNPRFTSKRLATSLEKQWLLDSIKLGKLAPKPIEVSEPQYSIY